MPTCKERNRFFLSFGFIGLSFLLFVTSLLGAETVLKWHLAIPSYSLKNLVQIYLSFTPAKRLKPNLDIVLMSAFREFTYRAQTDSQGFRKLDPAYWNR